MATELDTERTDRRDSVKRRRVVSGAAGLALVALAGCGGNAADENGTNGNDTNGGGADGNDTSGDGTDGDDMDGNGTDDGNETDGEDGADEEALVRVVHASPDAPNVDVFVDDESTLQDVPFRTVSEYLSLPAGEYAVRITAAGDADTVVFDDTVAVEAGTASSLVALGELNDDSFEVRAFADDVSAVADGEARVRLVHCSPDAPAVDVVPAGGSDPLFADVAFGEASDHATVPGGAYTLEVRPAGGDTAAATFDVELAGGTASTGFAMGYLDPESAAADEPFDLTLAVDVGGE
ncbi:DUF4397 domain-containing protein [Halorubrum sp. Atlit-26R]|uniref:DUF4397 domain-containing protein n=1 Tax=Halorubrum sp. Atlit-26R TaxID=2282128 RepID=UPI000EF225CA|nr:DUF4397 domain-containing protein [Halorubrum sp. Atlit-26R]RLM63023.1 DUF4397 domain-containing protein [Halorubrum sp. Atlit-26R]